MSLRPCASCGRHVRASESACPFCRTSLDPTPTPPSAPTVGRLGRAALFAFGAATTTVVAASVEGCGGAGPLYGGPPEDAAVVTDTGGPGPLYGGPPDAGTNDAATAPSDDAGNDAGNIAPPYGTPSEDAGSPAPAYGSPPSDAGPSQDAGLDAAGGIAPLYGGSPGS